MQYCRYLVTVCGAFIVRLQFSGEGLGPGQDDTSLDHCLAVRGLRSEGYRGIGVQGFCPITCLTK